MQKALFRAKIDLFRLLAHSRVGATLGSFILKCKLEKFYFCMLLYEWREAAEIYVDVVNCRNNSEENAHAWLFT